MRIVIVNHKEAVFGTQNSVNYMNRDATQILGLINSAIFAHSA